MHASISTFQGDPDDLLARYDAAVAELAPSSIQLQLARHGLPDPAIEDHPVNSAIAR